MNPSHACPSPSKHPERPLPGKGCDAKRPLKKILDEKIKEAQKNVESSIA